MCFIFMSGWLTETTLPGPALLKSFSVILPSGPVPENDAMSIPLSFAIFLIFNVARIFFVSTTCFF